MPRESNDSQEKKNGRVNLLADSRHPVLGPGEGWEKRSRSWNILKGTGRHSRSRRQPGLLALDLIKVVSLKKSPI